ncbi:MAG: right-handed parallel beta-helix repeat-containing protein [Candidatus Eisenbacteria sp.]|nr:right-handed parallel beta-helix repeat-containing protein [Candidatus Eisenbacteria bacterium]
MRQPGGIFLCFAALWFSAPARATTWYVPSPCPTIQAGIDSASAGDTVEVACGTYYEHGVDMKSGVCLRSETGQPDCVVIDGQLGGSVIECRYIEAADDTARVEGITITGGSLGGIYCDNAFLTISRCLLSRNHAAGNTGGAMHCYHSSPMIIDCTFSHNSVTWEYGAAISCGSTSCPTLQNTIIAFCTGGEPISCSVTSHPTLTCCNMYGNEGGDWVGCIEDQAGASGNFSADPQFCNPPENNYGLGDNSPCLPVNNGCGVLIGAFGESCTDSVVQRIEPLNWSTLKEAYR